MGTAQTGTLWRIVSTRMPTKWGMFDAIGFERDVSNGTRRVETALAIVMGDLTEGAPLLRIHSQCFTGEVLGSLRCDCSDQLEMAMRAIADEGRGLVIYEYEEGRGIGLMAKLQAYELQDAGFRHSSLPAPTAQIPWQRVLDEEPLDAAGASCPDPIYDPDATLALIYTSGTTGRPKGVTLSHANILADIDHLNYWMPHREGGVHLHAAPIFHIMDFPFIFAVPAFSSCQITIPKFSPASFCETVSRERVSRTVLVPTMINLLTQFPELKQFDLTSLEALAYGGSPMAPELIRRTREVLPHVKLVQGYGLSETGFLTGLQDHEHTQTRLMSCGRTCPGIDVRVVDELGREVEAGQHGELVARGANVMRGYWNNPEETSRAFQDGMFRTGDVGYRDADGYFYILDRLKDMIVTGGENVYSGEVEAVISQHPAVLEAAVFGIPDPQWGELVTACIVRKPGQGLGADELIVHCRRFLANYKIPRRVEFSETELPKGGSGKILKRAPRERFWVDQKRAVG